MNWRRELKSRPQCLAIKLGSSAITADAGGIDRVKLHQILQDVLTLNDLGLKTIIISSGAIHAGRAHLPALPEHEISNLQALSAVGQPLLMSAYHDFLAQHGRLCAQVLLTHDDFKNRTRYFNAQSTIKTLLAHNVIPILNENDTVSFSEITVGDNDQLAAMASQMLGVDLLLILTGSDGLFDRDPQDPTAVRIPEVQFLDTLDHIKTLTKSAAGRGGMKTKLDAIRKVTPLGIPVVLSSYRRQTPILSALQDSIGTFFHAEKKHREQRKGWLLTTVKHNAAVKIDAGAQAALLKSASLLPSGIMSVQGTFHRGDCIAIRHKNKTIAVGISEYDSRDIKKIAGKKVSEIQTTLGYCTAEEIIHRNNLVLKE